MKNTIEYTNDINLPYVAHKNDPIDIAKRMKNKKFVCSNININLHTIKAKTIGSKQQPNTQTLWKNDLKIN